MIISEESFKKVADECEKQPMPTLMLSKLMKRKLNKQKGK